RGGALELRHRRRPAPCLHMRDTGLPVLLGARRVAGGVLRFVHAGSLGSAARSHAPRSEPKSVHFSTSAGRTRATAPAIRRKAGGKTLKFRDCPSKSIA